MKTIIRLEEGVAEVHIVPTSALNKAHLALIRSYGFNNVSASLGKDDEIVFTFKAGNGEKYAETFEKSGDG